MKILFASLHTKPGFELTDVLFANYLKKKIDINFCAFSQKFYSKGGFYSYGNEFVNNEYFKKLNTKWMNYKEELKINILNHDVIIFSPIHGSREFVTFAKKHKKKVILLDSGFNYDFYPDNNADLIIFKGLNSMKVHFKHQQKYKNKQNFFIESCLQSIFLNKRYIMSKKQFLNKYKIKNKNYVLFLPTGPQYHDNKFKKKYKNICSFLIKKKFHLILKLHPSEYNKNKITNNYNKNNSYSLFKNYTNLTVCKQKDFYSAVKYAKYVFSTHTTAYVEVNLLQKPIIFIDRLDFFGVRNEKFYKTRKKINIYNLIDKKIIKNKLIGNMDKEKGFKFFGQDIKYENLNLFLKKGYKVNKSLFNKKLIYNNRLYCKNFNLNFYERISLHLYKYCKNVKLSSSKISFFYLFYLKSCILLKKFI